MRQRILTAALNWLGPRYPMTFVMAELLAALLVAAGGVALLSFYVRFDEDEFVRFLVFTEIVAAISISIGVMKARVWLKPVRRWLAGARLAADTVEAWRAAVSMPLQLVGRAALMQFVTPTLPVAVYGYFALDLSVFEAAILYLATSLTVGYAFTLHYFALELGMRPVVVKIAAMMPDELRGAPRVVSLRWKLLAGIPIINFFTGFTVAILSSDAHSGILGLGFDALVAVAVSFSLSLELTFLLSRSILVPVHEMVRATQRVSSGDLSVRVPITSNDELGVLARNFNEMIEGVSERETLREALGTYVDPNVAQMVIEEGELIEGKEVEATVMFADIRGFTAMAARSSPREVVKLLNNFYECVVPVLDKHGGHANKFVGDGMMAVFGVPERYEDHADRAVEAAREIVRALQKRFDGELRVGLGLNSGSVVAGSVGGGGRLEFTVIGDTVNVAARTEQFTRESGDPVLLTESTYESLSDRGGIEPREQVVVKGKQDPIMLYAAAVSEVKPAAESRA